MWKIKQNTLQSFYPDTHLPEYNNGVLVRFLSVKIYLIIPRTVYSSKVVGSSSRATKYYHLREFLCCVTHVVCCDFLVLLSFK